MLWGVGGKRQFLQAEVTAQNLGEQRMGFLGCQRSAKTPESGGRAFSYINGSCGPLGAELSSASAKGKSPPVVAWLCLVTSEHCARRAHAHFKTKKKKRKKRQRRPFSTHHFPLLYSGESATTNNVRECVSWEDSPVRSFCADEVTVSHTSNHF